MHIEQQARQAVLDALLSRAPLPGGAQPLVFPDLPDLADAPEVVLVASADDPELALPDRVRTITPTSTRTAVANHPRAPVLEYLTPEPLPDRVGVRLRLSASDERGRLWPLGEVVATFVAGADGALSVSEPTHVLAY